LNFCNTSIAHFLFLAFDALDQFFYFLFFAFFLSFFLLLQEARRKFLYIFFALSLLLQEEEARVSFGLGKLLLLLPPIFSCFRLSQTGSQQEAVART
jgi:uncharacterized membrane protein